MKAELIKANSEGMKDTAWKKNGQYIIPVYPLNITLDMSWEKRKDKLGGLLYLAPPIEKGNCHCIIPVWEGKEVIGPYINLSSAELMKLGKLLIKIAQEHPRDKPYKKPENIS